ncbi:hypothetical protein K440DRAFT_655556 [Wilcoxina mikolae CBS 423.85]|nr:hypothetical protein K440DRAFT_655556 [Wilcoxina mikolae CBS 423.85]
MPLWNCDIASCKNPGVRIHGDCILCKRHLCTEHLDRAHHKCPEWKDAEQYDLIRDQAIQDEFSSDLRGGIVCTIATPSLDIETLRPGMGNVNFHIQLRFQDGVSWVARIKRNNVLKPLAAIVGYMIRSEVATYRFLENTAVPAPKVGCAYILMEKINGRTLSSTSPTKEQMRKVLAHLADVPTWNRPYRPIANELLADATSNNTKNPANCNLPGPFQMYEAYYTSLLLRILDLIANGELYSPWAVDAFLIHRFLLDLVPSFSMSSHDKEGHVNFYLRHVDDKGDHVMVDDDYNITGIIDWEWAYTAPAEEAFSSPMGLWDVSDFFEGVDGLSDREWVFTELLMTVGGWGGYEVFNWDLEGYVGLFQALRRTVGMQADVGWEEWKVEALERFKGDERLRLLRRCGLDGRKNHES